MEMDGVTKASWYNKPSFYTDGQCSNYALAELSFYEFDHTASSVSYRIYKNPGGPNVSKIIYI